MMTYYRQFKNREYEGRQFNHPWVFKLATLGTDERHRGK